MSIEVYDQNGSIVFNSNYIVGGEIYDVFISEVNQYGSPTYTHDFPDYAGKTLRVNFIEGDLSGITITYSPGYPRLIVNTSIRQYFFITFS